MVFAEGYPTVQCPWPNENVARNRAAKTRALCGTVSAPPCRRPRSAKDTSTRRCAARLAGGGAAISSSRPSAARRGLPLSSAAIRLSDSMLARRPRRHFRRVSIVSIGQSQATRKTAASARKALSAVDLLRAPKDRAMRA